MRVHSNQQNEAHAARRSPFGTVDRLWLWFIEGLAALGTALIGVLMIIICADIIARNLMGSSLPLVSELGALLLVMIVSLQLATTVRANRLARTDLFFAAFLQSRPLLGSLLSAVFNLFGAAVIGGIAWASIGILGKDWSAGEFIGITGIATLPTWPFRTLILLGMAVAAIEFVVRTVSDLRSAGGREVQS